jgi:hypothetical protein
LKSEASIPFKLNYARESNFTISGENYMKDILLISLPSIAGLILAYLSYKFGKRSKKYETLLSKAVPLAEQIIELLQKIESSYNYLMDFHKINFHHCDNIDVMVNSFESHGVLYEEEQNVIQELIQNRLDLSNLCRSARIYLDNNLLTNIENYIKTGDFSFSSAVGYDDFNKNFWTNLLREENNDYRIALYKDTIKHCHKLLPK